MASSQSLDLKGIANNIVTGLVSEMATHGEEESHYLIPWKAVKHRGVILYEFCTELDQISSLKVRDDDVWVCTYPRSGTTLTQEIVYLIQNLDFEKARTELLDDRAPFIDIIHTDPIKRCRGVKYVEELASPRVLKTHLHHFLLPEALRAGKGKIVYVLRNPNACALSYYKLNNYYRTCQADTLQEYMEMFLNEEIYQCPWWLHVLQYWEHRNEDNVLFMIYEELVMDKKNHIRKIANFLGKTMTEDEITRIYEHTDIANMQRNAAVNNTWHKTTFKTDTEYGAFINHGSINGWRTEVPPDIQQLMNVMIQRRLGHTDLTF